MSWFRLDHKDLVTVVHSQPGPCSHCSQYLCLGALIPILVLFSTSHGFSLISPFLQSLSRITRCSRFGSQAMPAQNMHLGHGHPYFFFTSLFLKLCPLKFGFTSTQLTSSLSENSKIFKEFQSLGFLSSTSSLAPNLQFICKIATLSQKYRLLLFKVLKRVKLFPKINSASPISAISSSK